MRPRGWRRPLRGTCEGHPRVPPSPWGSLPLPCTHRREDQFGQELSRTRSRTRAVSRLSGTRLMPSQARGGHAETPRRPRKRYPRSPYRTRGTVRSGDSAGVTGFPPSQVRWNRQPCVSRLASVHRVEGRHGTNTAHEPPLRHGPHSWTM
jgi:hypothetical protein